MKYEDIKEGTILYDKWHEVKVIEKVEHVDVHGQLVKDIYIQYINQPWHPKITGDGNLSEEPLHCWNCQRDLIDNVYLNICPSCHRAICTDINCAKCHCGTTWERKKRNKQEIRVGYSTNRA